MIATTPVREAFEAPPAYKILLMAALPQEVRPFLRRIKARPRPDLGLPAWEWESQAAVVAVSGMGAAAARRAGEILLKRCRPEFLVSLGFAGALTPGLAAGDVVLGEAFWHYDADTRQLRPGSEPASRHLTPLHQALGQAGLVAARASLVSTTRIIHKGRHGPALSALPRPVLDLETAILAELAAAQALPFLSLRAITDVHTEEIPKFLRDAAGQEPTTRLALAWLAEDLSRVSDLLRLWRRSRRAARSLSEALMILWPHLSAR
jgi:adenosylhomocysteine nucleosidase